jgi:hypothetical protein
MCGIFGLFINSKTSLKSSQLKSLTKSLFHLSESRGKDSAGIAYLSFGNDLESFKTDLSAHRFLKTSEFCKLQNSVFGKVFRGQDKIINSMAFVGHCRMVTNGSEEDNLNNQPIIKRDIATIHNGIICNVEKIWSDHPTFKREAKVDTEILNDLIASSLKDSTTKDAVRHTFSKIEGSASIAVLLKESNELVLASNTGSLYFAINQENSIVVFASEKFILDNALSEAGMKNNWRWIISALGNRKGLIFSLESGHVEEFTLDYTKQPSTPLVSYQIASNPTLSNLEKRLIYRIEELKKLRRCTKCVLPETFPFISFNEEGVCNYCQNYVTRGSVIKKDELVSVIDKARTTKGEFDCIVPFSGGRDSSYGLHYLVRELGVSPITYTYDWGMVTDLARRNISRICASLGLENILISADIKSKRRNIRKNVLAWLKKPDLGMVPLFMAGDKQFLYYVNKIKKQTGVTLDIWMPNRLENTEFKTGFCGIEPFKDKKRIDALPLVSKFQMIRYYAKSYIENPSYVNSSLMDTAFAYFSYYFEPRTNFTVLFDYIPWNETTINRTLIEEYNWEISPDSSSTWRIGDGTAPFYNYIYNTVAGFSEIDTFRSNQIREGMLTRNEALKLVECENAPRFESLKWYLDTLNLDFVSTIDRINKIPALY